jgi:TolB protein
VLLKSATLQNRVDDAPSTATRLPYPSATPTRTPLLIADLTLIPETELTATSTPATTTNDSSAQAKVLASSLNVREGPGVDYPVVGVAYAGEFLNIVGTSNSHWVQVVTTNGRTGWISGQPAYTQISGSLNGMPLVQVAPPDPAVRASNGSNGKLIFMNASGGDLFAINTDGTNLQHLASGVIDPAVSPDGQYIAFTRWDGAEMGTVFTLNLATGEEQVVLGETLQAKSPTWSPDGREIIVSFQHGGLRDPIAKCKTLLPGESFDFSPDKIIFKFRVNPDGTIRVCYIRKEDLQWGLRRVNLTTGKFDDLPRDTYSFTPVWDPQNPWRVIYDGNKGLMQLDVTNGTLWPVTTDLRDTGPVFSSDGQKLALTYKQHDHWEVYTLDLTTGERQRLTKPPLLADPQYSSASPAWSPDGRKLAFITNRTGQWEIWAMNADGSNQHPLFSPEIQGQLGLQYWGMNERMLNWIE